MRFLIAVAVLSCLCACKYAATPEGDAKREADAKQVESLGGAASAASALLPPPFNLIVSAAVGVGATLAAQKIRGNKPAQNAQ